MILKGVRQLVAAEEVAQEAAEAVAVAVAEEVTVDAAVKVVTAGMVVGEHLLQPVVASWHSHCSSDDGACVPASQSSPARSAIVPQT